MAHEIRNLIEEFKCPVCLQIMKRDIFRLINCGHSLCTDCYYRSHFRCNSGRTEHCPVCRNAISHSGDFGSRFLQHTDKHLESLVNKLYALSDSHNVKENTIYPDYANKLIKNTGQTIFNTILSNYRFLSEKEENCLDELREEIKLSDNEKQQELASTAHTVSEAKIKLFYEFLGDFERIKYNRETSMAKKLSIERTVTVFLKYGKKSIQSKLNIFTKWNNLYAQLVKDNSDIFLIQPKFHEMKINLYHLSVRRKTETDYYKYKDSCLKFTFPEGSQIPFMHLNQVDDKDEIIFCYTNEDDIYFRDSLNKHCFTTYMILRKGMTYTKIRTIYYVCGTCQLKDVCEPCILQCHKNHNVKVSKTEYTHEWACCGCSQQKDKSNCSFFLEDSKMKKNWSSEKKN